MANGSQKSAKLDRVMKLLNVSAVQLSGLCGVSNSLISRWQKGTRPLTPRSESLRPLVSALLSLDTDNVLDDALAPWLTNGESKEEALRLYLTEAEEIAMPARAEPPKPQQTGSYLIEQQALLGKRGFHDAALLMLDYVTKLPPGQKVIVCAHGGFDLWHGDIPFAIQFLLKMRKAVKRQPTCILITREAPGRDGSPWFSLFWLTIHLKGIARSRYYEGDAPSEHFVGIISGYWSGKMEPDSSAEDGIMSLLTTDPRLVAKDEAHCKAFLERSAPASQYGFLETPGGTAENPIRWESGALPRPKTQEALDVYGSFSAICRTPSFGIMTKEEFAELVGSDVSPTIPDYLFNEGGGFTSGAHRIILCREDIKEGLLDEYRPNPTLSKLLKKDVRVPRTMLAAQLKRLLSAMKKNKDFEVALIPRSAFKKLEMELIYWPDSAALGWLQDNTESMFDVDPVTICSFASAVDHTWSKLHKGWKRYRNVSATLRDWTRGIGLDEHEEDSAIVKHWDIFPRE